MAAFNQSLSMQTAMRQNMAMTPQMIQAMELLELPLLDLEQRLQHEAAANPALELGELADQSANQNSDDDLDTQSDQRDDIGGGLSENPPTENFRDDQSDTYTDTDGNFSSDSPDAGGLDCDWENTYEDSPDWRASSSSSRRNDDEDFDPLNLVADRQISIDEYLEQQLGLLSLTARENSLCRAIIGNLDERGYFMKNLATLGENLEPPPLPSEQKKALATVQNFSPSGIAATSVSECFLLQLRDLPDTDETALTKKIVREYLEDLTNNRLPKIAKGTATTIEEVKDAIAILRGLNPFPGKNYARANEPLARPDVFIDLVDAEDGALSHAETAKEIAEIKFRQAEKDKELGYIEEYAVREAQMAFNDAQTAVALFEDGGARQWTVRVKSGMAIDISPTFLALFDNTARGRTLRENWESDPQKREMLRELTSQVGGDLRKKFRENYFNAGSIIRAVKQREITLYRLTCEVIVRQKDYLTGRSATPAPLMMKELAEKLAMDNGTVSRAMSDKYADTPIGLRPLREFFTRAVAETAPVISAGEDGEKGGGEKISNGLIRNRIAAMIAGENKSAPLKDHIIQQMLADEGIMIKRRTVAKHRGMLGIGDFMQRREY